MKSDEYVDVATQVELSENTALTNVVKIAAGESHALALTADGKVYAWGGGEKGQLGNGYNEDSNYPVLVNGITNAVDIAAGENHSVALMADGTVYAWGSNESGQIGHQQKASSVYGTNASEHYNVPVIVTDFGETKHLESIVGISAGGNHTSALTTSGVVYTWGRNVNSQLGMNDTNPADRYDVPREVLGDADSEFKYNVAKISAGDEHTAALSQNGNVWTWGYNYYGRLGDGSGETRAMPGKVVTALNYETFDLEGIVDIGAGITHSLAIAADGSIYAWGDNMYGELGDGTKAQKSTAVKVVNEDGSDFSGANGISAGNEHSVLFTNMGEIYTWGHNDQGQLGTALADGETSASVPQCIGSSSEGSKGLVITKINVTGTPVGETYTTVPESISIFPTQNVAVDLNTIKVITSISRFNVYTSMSTGGSGGSTVSPSDITISTDSDLLTIDNATGVISPKTATSYGIAKVTVKHNPTQYTKSFNIVIKPEYSANKSATIVGGSDFTIALKADGSVWTWGNNTHGQLGNGKGGNNAQVINPQQIALSNISSVAAGKEFAMALTDDGNVYTWGANESGQLGIGSVDDKSTPQKVSFDLAVGEYIIRISAGDNFAMALTSAGDVYVWGNNDYSQMGLGNTMAHSDFYSPSKIESITGATMITAGANHAMVYAVGKVYTWGANDSGQLGKGTDTFSASTDGVPKEINIPTSIATVDQIIARGDYSAIISDGKAYLWGANGNYQLGNNSDTNVLSVPDTALNIEENIQAMALGYSHIVAITEKRQCICLG